MQGSEAGVRAFELGTVGRRRLLGTTGDGAVALGVLMAAFSPKQADAQVTNDVAIANFALNFEYLGAELCLRARTGQGLGAAFTTGAMARQAGRDWRGKCRSRRLVQQLISQFGADEEAHVSTLRAAVGANAIAECQIDLVNRSATRLARAVCSICAHH